jgi:IS5 family transposase
MFLYEMEAVVPWQALIDLIKPHYSKASKIGGRPTYPLATMLRVHLLQQWYALSDPAMEEDLIEVPTMCHFVGIELGEQIHCFAEDFVYETVKAHLHARGMTMRQLPNNQATWWKKWSGWRGVNSPCRGGSILAIRQCSQTA